MFDRIKRLYDSGMLTKNGLKNAVANDLITAEEYETIAGEKYDG